MGIKASLVLRDAAAEVGESVNVASDSNLGPKFDRSAGPASRVLRQVAGDAWYIDASGVTQLGTWPTRKVPSAFTVENQDGARGLFTIATEDYAAWLPGATFTAAFISGTYTVNAVSFTFGDDGKLRLEVLT